jgi:hypothetical protein
MLMVSSPFGIPRAKDDRGVFFPSKLDSEGNFVLNVLR